jgi:ComF family protein
MSCYGETSLDGVFAALSYRDPVVQSCVETLKYRFVPSLAKPLGRALAQSLEYSGVPLPDIIIPVPLHPFRYRWRGFNQAELIANELQKHVALLTDTPLLTNTLIRNRLTKPQAKTKTREKRLASLRNAFALSDTVEANIRNARVWLIDDVSTTNATFSECAKPFKVAGAKEIWGIAAAR